MRKRYEFRPDSNRIAWKDRLYLTKKQRFSLLKWFLYGLLMLALSLLQDVVMSRFQFRGGTTDLVPCGILLICLLQAPESGGIFALVSSILYVLTGSSHGYACIVLLTFLGVLLNVVRHGLLSKRFRSIFLCLIVGIFAYEMAVFFLGVFLGDTYFARISVFLATGLLSMAAVPVLYPIAFAIGKIGGEKWKD